LIKTKSKLIKAYEHAEIFKIFPTLSKTPFVKFNSKINWYFIFFDKQGE